MQRVERAFQHDLFRNRAYNLTPPLEALTWIIGASPAMMRPRRPFFTLPRSPSIYTHLLPPAYGNYNDLVRQVSLARGQTLINWDLE